MTIVNANVLSAKDDILNKLLSLGVNKPEQNTDEWLMINLGTDMFGAWLSYDEDEIVGMLLVEVIEGNMGYVAVDWVKNGLSKNGMFEKAEKWAKDLGLDKLIKYTDKDTTTFVKKFGWSVWQTVLIKEL
jgi:hypothetical protein